MHIGIEATPLRNPTVGGVFRYTDNLVRTLGDLHHPSRYSLLLFNSWKPWARTAPPPCTLKNTVLRQVDGVPSHAFTLYASLGFKPRGHFAVESFVGSVDVFHSVNALAVPQRAGRRVLTIHDLTCLRVPRHHPKLRVFLFRIGIRRSARTADAIIVPCQQTRQDVVTLLNVPEKKIYVIPYAPAEPFGRLPRQIVTQALTRYALPRREYLLFAGNLEPRKNLLGLIRAYERLRRDSATKPLLVLAGGRGWCNRDIHHAIATSPFSRDIRMLGYVPDDDLAALMNGAALFVYPSFYEGFGFPVIEAMACGTPVIASSIMSLREVAGDAALLVDPSDDAGLAEAIRRLLTDQDLCEEFRSRGLNRASQFSWNETARRTFRVYEDVVGRDRLAG